MPWVKGAALLVPNVVILVRATAGFQLGFIYIFVANAIIIAFSASPIESTRTAKIGWQRPGGGDPEPCLALDGMVCASFPAKPAKRLNDASRCILCMYTTVVFRLSGTTAVDIPTSTRSGDTPHGIRADAGIPSLWRHLGRA